MRNIFMGKYTTNTSLRLNRFFFICGAVMFASEAWKQWYLTYRVNQGVYQWWYFPFQLCSIAMYVLLLLPWVEKPRLRSALLSFLMCYSLLGGIAVFADTSGLQYPAVPLTIHSYTWHILLIGIGITAGIVNLKERSARKSFYRQFIDSTFIYLGCCFMALVINHFADSKGLINMFYINPDYKMQQIGFSALIDYIGNTAAILLYVGATILGAGILFCIWGWISRKLQKRAGLRGQVF